jgi:hypothetical protein
MTKGRVKHAENFVRREVDGQVAFIKDDGLAIYVLNKTAVHIWEMCNGDLRPDEIAAGLCERYDVSFERASVDVKKALASLMENGLLKCSD